jgi:PelA/Pel-15E family pectate lyase
MKQLLASGGPTLGLAAVRVVPSAWRRAGDGLARVRRGFGLVLLLAAGAPAGAAPFVWKGSVPKDPAWTASAEARALAENLLLYQLPSGGWPKNTDMARPLSAAEKAQLAKRTDAEATIDNGATTGEIRALAAIHVANGEARFRAAVEKGIAYLLAAQYANGGWPQYFPLRPGYHRRITFNDQAMVRVLEVLDDVAAGRSPFGWTDPALRTRAGEAVGRGVACILRCQIVTEGVRTAWGAQHDEVTFAPTAARAFEPVSLASAESVGIVRFLLRDETPPAEVVAAVTAAVAWLRAVRIDGAVWETVDAPDLPKGRDRVFRRDPAAGPLWARFYEIGTNRPIFIGRDRVIHYAVAEIEHERRVGYAWYNDSAKSLLEREFPRWQRRVKAAVPAKPSSR